MSRRAVPFGHRPHTQTSRSFLTSLRPVPLLSRALAVPFIRLTPRGQEHSAELHHSGTMMPRHTIGNPRYETSDLRTSVSITVVSQTHLHMFTQRTDPEVKERNARPSSIRTLIPCNNGNPRRRRRRWTYAVDAVARSALHCSRAGRATPHSLLMYYSYCETNRPTFYKIEIVNANIYTRPASPRGADACRCSTCVLN